jgi:hypothetical protein
MRLGYVMSSLSHETDPGQGAHLDHGFKVSLRASRDSESLGGDFICAHYRD